MSAFVRRALCALALPLLLAGCSTDSGSGGSYAVSITSIAGFSINQVTVNFTIDNSGNFTVGQFGFVPDAAQPPATLQDAGGSYPIGINSGASGYTEQVSTTVYAGNAYLIVGVEGVYGVSAAFPWTFRTSCADGSGSATPIAPPVMVTVTGLQAGTSSWYTYTPSAPASLTVDVTADSDGDPGLTVYDSTCTLVDTSDVAGTDSITFNATAQTYYFEVYDSVTYNYVLNLN